MKSQVIALYPNTQLDFDASIQLELGGRIWGYIKDPNNNPLPNVALGTFTSTPFGPIMGGFSNGDGIYRHNVPSNIGLEIINYITCQSTGSWYLNLNNPNNNWEKPFMISPDQIRQIDVYLDPAAKIFGKVTDKITSLPIDNINVSALGTGFGFSSRTDQFGNYCLFVPEGDYKLGFSPIHNTSLFHI